MAVPNIQPRFITIGGVQYPISDVQAAEARMPQAQPQYSMAGSQGAGAGFGGFGGGFSGGSSGGGGGFLDSLGGIGGIAGAAGGIVNAIGSAFSDPGTTPAMHAQMKASLPARAMVSMTPEQKAMFEYLQKNTMSEMQKYDRGGGDLQQFAQGINLTGNAMSDLRGRATALAAKYSGGA